MIGDERGESPLQSLRSVVMGGDMPSEFTTQINPRVPNEIKAQIDAMCKERGVLVGEIVTTALRQYFGMMTTEEDRLHELQQQGMQILAALQHVVHTLDALGSAPPPPAVPAPPGAPPQWTDDGRVVAAPTRRGWRGWRQ
jgi:hypothetical protein